MSDNNKLVDQFIHNGSADESVNVWDDRNIYGEKYDSNCLGGPNEKDSTRAPCLLEKYEANYEQFKEVEVGDKIVYFHQRKIGEAIVEKDFIVYQFDKNTEELLAKKTQWQNDLPKHLTQSIIAKEEAESLVEGEVQFSKLYIISPESDVFPIKPTPTNPCWIVRSIDNGNLIVTIVDAVDGRILGNGVPPPYTAFSMSGPQYFDPCGGVWYNWYKNAEFWFSEMGYSTESVEWPTEEKIKSHIQSNETATFYEIAHSGGRSDQFKSGCLNGDEPEYTYAYEIEEWIANYTKMPFAFLASCFSMCNTSDGNLSYEFRKGSMKNTVTIGYCNMSDEICHLCWIYSLDWQDTLFDYMNQSYTVKHAFDLANAEYPVCACANCMRFVGDEDFKVVPMVKRVPFEHDIAITDVSSSKTIVGQGFTLSLNVFVENQGSHPETFNVTAYANTTIIDTYENITLTSGNTKTLTFTWNTTDIAKGNYTISATAEAVLGETNLADNTYTDGKVIITIIGDVTGDGKVNILDIATVASLYDTYLGHPKWNPNADLNDDNLVNILDIATAARHYGKKDC